MTKVVDSISVPNFIGKPWDQSAIELEDVLHRIRVLLVGGSLERSALQELAESAEALAYKTIEDDGSAMPAQDTVNFVGALVEDEGYRTTVTIPPPTDTPSVAAAADEQALAMNLRVGLDSLALRRTITRSYR